VHGCVRWSTGEGTQHEGPDSAGFEGAGRLEIFKFEVDVATGGVSEVS
jgi:hypothetical protein